MGVSFYTNEFDVIEWDDIKKIVPKEAGVFEAALQTAEKNLTDFCDAMINGYEDWEIDDDLADRITKAWDKVSEMFTKKTTVGEAGLRLDPTYHDPDDDEPEGFIAVYGVYELTPAGIKYQEKIERRQYSGIG
jgi:hypothetical protein